LEVNAKVQGKGKVTWKNNLLKHTAAVKKGYSEKMQLF